MTDFDATCQRCGTSQTSGATGRPRKYCSPQCRQAAHRARQGQSAAPGPLRTAGASTVPASPPTLSSSAQVQAARVVLAADLVKDQQDVLRQITRQLNMGARAVSMLPYLLDLERQIEYLKNILVSRAHYQKTPWKDIGEALGVSADTARTRYRDSEVTRRLNRLPRPRASSDKGAASGGSPEPPDADDHQEVAITAGNQASAVFNRLAPVLSSLARVSGLSVQTIADRLGISASFLYRVLSGERVPTWSLTERFARVCGADIAVLRRVWETERLREKTPAPALLPTPVDEGNNLTVFRTALRTLYVRAGQPGHREVALATQWRLPYQRIHEVLADGTLPPWEDVQLIVRALAGDVVAFRKLWLAADHRPANQQPNATALADEPSEAPPTGDGSQTLIERFHDVLAGPAPLEPERESLLRRRRAARRPQAAAPIAAMTPTTSFTTGGRP